MLGSRADSALASPPSTWSILASASICALSACRISSLNPRMLVFQLLSSIRISIKRSLASASSFCACVSRPWQGVRRSLRAWFSLTSCCFSVLTAANSSVVFTYFADNSIADSTAEGFPAPASWNLVGMFVLLTNRSLELGLRRTSIGFSTVQPAQRISTAGRIR